MWCRNMDTDKEGYKQFASRNDEISVQISKSDEKGQNQKMKLTVIN